MKEVNYLEGKRFKDFKPDDTIYITLTKQDHSNTYFCRVIELVSAKKVKVRIVAHASDSRLHYHDDEEVIVSMNNCSLFSENGYRYFKPTGEIEEAGEDIFGHEENHPAYGILQIGKFQGGSNTFFGSSIKHNGGISLKIYPASITRRHSDDWYHAYHSKPYIDVEMSYTQFAEAITSGMSTEGTPCTIRAIDGEVMPKVDFVNKRLQFENEMKGKMVKLSDRLDKLTEEAEEILNAGKAPNKGERQFILNAIEGLRTEIKSNVPFVLTQFNEQMDKTVKEAKGEIEGFYDQKIHSLGLEKLHEEAKLLDKDTILEIEGED